MYLMIQDTPILQFNFDEQIYKVLDENRLPVKLRGIFMEEHPADVKTAVKYYEALTGYFAGRVLNLDRKNAKKILNAYHFSQMQDTVTKTKIAIACKAVSMADDYWINDDSFSFLWENINPRENKLNEIISHIALTGSSITATGLPHTPEMTGQGAYAKAWIREKDGVYLYKMGTGNNEELTEAEVSNILDCFDVDHVSYSLTEFDHYRVSKCLNMCDDNRSIVPAEDFYSYCCRTGKDFMKEVLSVDEEVFCQTCIVDYLISNSDRHMQNWGFYQNNRTGEIYRMHPLYDHNNAFDKGDMEDENGGMSLMVKGKTKREAAEMSLKMYPLRCIKPVKKDMFYSEEHYNSFMKRACSLGLYKQNQKSFLDKLRHKGEDFVPVKIECSIKREYECEENFEKSEGIQPGTVYNKVMSEERGFTTQKEKDCIIR